MPLTDDDDVRYLRRCLRDVVALTMLPSVWTGSSSEQICNDLVDVVMRTLNADAVFLSAPSRGVADILRRRSGIEWTDPDLRRLTFPLSSGSDDQLTAVSYRADFPNDSERLLLRVAANQAAMWLERKDAEGRLAAEASFRRSIEESMLAGVAAVDTSGRQSYVNRAFATMVGWDESELVGGTPPFVYWAPEDLDHIANALQEVLAGRANPNGYELRFRRRDESRFDALVLISTLRDATHEGFLAAVYDITARKRAEHESRFLAEAGEILGRSLDYESTLQAISALAVPRLADWCLIDLVDADGTIHRLAAAHADPADEPVALRLRRTYPPLRSPYSVAEMYAGGSTVLRNEVPEEYLRTVARDEDHREALLAMNIRAFVSVPMTSRGKLFGLITFLGTKHRTHFDDRDVALAEELARRAALAVDNARLYREAQEANRAKDEFLANLSHELRTPMTAILGWAHLLHLGGIDEAEVRLGIETIRQSGLAQARLIDELLDVSRIITGKLHLSTSAVAVLDVVRAAAAAIRPAADAKRQQLEVDIPDDPDLRVFGDAARLQQVFWNLLSNAVKFTPAGGTIAVKAERTSSLKVTIEDSGEGIAPELLPHIFERFRQAAGRRTGLGLGLAIAKELIELHGGSITAQSAGPGRGATFTVTLPLHAEQQRAAAPAVVRDTHQRLDAVRVLLVEDDHTTRTLLDAVLRNFGAEVRSTSCAADARVALQSFAADILISDIEMPGDDGVTLLQSLRGENTPRFPAIAVTAYADEPNRNRVLAAGFDGFVPKPLDPHALADAIERAISGTASSGAERAVF